jgi:hypothetical protein
VAAETVNELDPRLIFWAVYGAGLLAVYGLLLRRRLMHLRKHRDPRAFRDAMEGVGLFLVALATAIAITWALFGPRGTGMVGILSAVAAATFLVVGIYALSERQPANGGSAARRQ